MRSSKRCRRYVISSWHASRPAPPNCWPYFHSGRRCGSASGAFVPACRFRQSFEVPSRARDSAPPRPIHDSSLSTQNCREPQLQHEEEVAATTYVGFQQRNCKERRAACGSQPSKLLILRQAQDEETRDEETRDASSTRSGSGVLAGGFAPVIRGVSLRTRMGRP